MPGRLNPGPGIKRIDHPLAVDGERLLAGVSIGPARKEPPGILAAKGKKGNLVPLP
jgi:hypothetical protein